ncbi:MAG: hypothetical protein QW303_07140 [Nitrososphaerota archaeon]
MSVINEIISRMKEDEVYEVYPLSGVHKASDLPDGYCGEAYYRDDPRLVERLKELEAEGWTLPMP